MCRDLLVRLFGMKYSEGNSDPNKVNISDLKL